MTDLARHDRGTAFFSVSSLAKQTNYNINIIRALAAFPNKKKPELVGQYIADFLEELAESEVDAS